MARFLRAQASVSAGYDVALAELRAGRKVGHWVWYVFPQLAGLGSSETAQRFALADADEAWEYLSEPVLGERLLRAMEIVERHDGSLVTLMGGRLDAQKLVSCVTLFARVAQLHAGDPAHGARAAMAVRVGRALLERAAEAGLPACTFTQDEVG